LGGVRERGPPFICPPTSDTSTPLFSQGLAVEQLGGDVHLSPAFARAVGEEPLFLEELDKIEYLTVLSYMPREAVCET